MELGAAPPLSPPTIKSKVKSFHPAPPHTFQYIPLSTYIDFYIYYLYIYTKLIRLYLDNIYVNQLIIK